jgi:hypothetical protein
MEIHQYAVGWFTLSLVTAGIAQGKNRSGLGWWFIGVLLGPLALLLLLALDRVPDLNAMEQRISTRIADEVRRLETSRVS